MKERPILFTPANAQKIYSGTKTQTRRIMKPQPHMNYKYPPSELQPDEAPPGSWYAMEPGDENFEDVEQHWNCPFGTDGDRLWIKESHCLIDGTEGDPDLVGYRADKSIRIVHVEEPTAWNFRKFVNSEPDQENCADDYRDLAKDKWRSGMFMPRYASRTLVEITEIRVERLLDISEDDAQAEGAIPCSAPFLPSPPCAAPHRHGFQKLWDSINAKTHPWSSNPWVWAISFKRI